jgi:DNA helicase-2/ATP-dependent DNA helicase PcrA
VGLEEGILPHARSMLTQTEMEEERRLMYVGITRAKKKVYLLFTGERNIFGSTQCNPPSRFLDDIPSHLIENFEKENSNLKIKKVENYSSSQFRRMENVTLIKKTDFNRHLSGAKNYKDGDWIQHEIFGAGLIIASNGDILTVAFKKAGLKKISASLAPIKKIS